MTERNYYQSENIYIIRKSKKKTEFYFILISVQKNIGDNDKKKWFVFIIKSLNNDRRHEKKQEKEQH